MEDLRICSVCTSLQPEDARRCAWCDWPRPSAGWSDPETLADPWIGELVPGNLTIVQRLSSADSLYRASDRSGRNFFAKFCAIHRLATPGNWLERSKALKSVRSRHIARFVGALEIDEYAVFLSDYVDGERLADRLRRTSPLEVDLALSIAVQIAVAIESLHAVALTHGRLDPRSIVIHTDSRGELRATVCSFGLAAGVRPEVTAPEYLPPTRRSFGSQTDDIYGIGAILFEMLTGVSPADGMVDADMFDIAASPLRNPKELNPILHRYSGVDATVRDFTASEDFRIANISAVVEMLEHARVNAANKSTLADAPRQRPRTFTGPTHQTGLGAHKRTTPTSRPKTDGRRTTVVPFEGEEHIVKLRGTELKLRRLSGSNRWGPESTRFDLRDYGIGGQLECVASLGNEIWFGTSTGILGVFDVEARAVRQVGAELSGGGLAAVAVSEGLVVAGTRNGTVMYRLTEHVVQLPCDRPVSHVSVADRASRFAVARVDGTVTTYDVVDGAAAVLNEFRLDEVTGVALSVDGRQVALSDRESTVVRDVESGERLGNLGQFSALINTSDVMRALTESRHE